MVEETLVLARDADWSAPAGQLALAQRKPVLARLDGLGSIAAGGPDAAAFLNGQMTVDMAKLAPEQWQLGAYCSVKGRVLAIFETWRGADGFHLVMPSDRVGALVGRLSRFVLRAKVTLRDESSGWQFYGITGPGALQALDRAGFACPASVWTHASPLEGIRLAHVPSSPSTGERVLLAVSAQADPAWRRRLAGLSEVDAAVWWWSKIDAGLPDVFQATEERFVPQTLNLDVLGAVHFGKGCYPGQEVVARSQYRGKLKRRMARAHAVRARAGEDVLAADPSDPTAGTVAGTVVMAAASPAGGVDLLLECATERPAAQRLSVAGSDDSELTVQAPPYPIVNPTA